MKRRTSKVLSVSTKSSKTRKRLAMVLAWEALTHAEKSAFMTKADMIIRRVVEVA